MHKRNGHFHPIHQSLYKVAIATQEGIVLEIIKDIITY